MRVADLQETGAIYFKEICTGLREYANEIISMNEQEAYGFFREMWKTKHSDSAFVDFYYFKLEKEAQQKIREILIPEEISYLEKLEETLRGKNLQEELFFPMEEELLKIATRLNYREMLFSTVYFAGEAGERSTWWGNYGGTYVRVWEEKLANG